METKFKKILSAIDQVAAVQTESELFSNQETIINEDQYLLESWLGKPATSLIPFLHSSYAKKQLTNDPFSWNKDKPVIEIHLLEADDQPVIRYTISDTPYGNVIIASTDAGVCFLVFYSGAPEKAAGILQKEFKGSTIVNEPDNFQQNAIAYINGEAAETIHLHIRGSERQLLIWKTLTNVGFGKLISYGGLAKATNQIAKDIGTVMGENLIAMLIPCHRVIKTTGELGYYHWGAKRKQAMILREACIA